MKQTDRKTVRIKDYQRFAMIFLMLALFLSVGFLLPEPSEQMRTLPGMTLWMTALAGAILCMVASRRFQSQLDKENQQ
ncbi:hypothetical protein DH09_08500 [Bacillaceae bacterium JMAK1]|nr:hypothetical protein DH09_08500 [Bacillaceae bacterium JMAK1]